MTFRNRGLAIQAHSWAVGRGCCGARDDVDAGCRHIAQEARSPRSKAATLKPHENPRHPKFLDLYISIR